MHDATALAAAIDAGHVTAAQVMEASLSACAARADLGAVVHADPDMARAGAKAADEAPKTRRGPFHGLPFLVKDLGGAAQGLPAAAGSAALRTRGAAPAEDSDLMAGFRASGLIPFGITATPPFGASLSCEPDGLPPTRNPWNRALTPGGSSGGAAAAVAAGIVAIAHATDAAGSIRVPAACCGLTGLKPSRAAVPGGPEFSNHLMGIASELVLARSVRDVTTALCAVAPSYADTVLPERPRVGVAMPDGCDPAQQRAIGGMAEALRDAGCAVQPVAPPDAICAEAQTIAWTILGVSLAEWLMALDLSDSDIPPLASAMATSAHELSATDLFALTRDMARLSHRAAALFTASDAVLMPVLSGPPAPVGTFDLFGTDLDTHRAGMQAFAPYVALANVAGLPALALPFGLSEGLPLGAQLVGPRGSDMALLRLGALIEARAPELTFPHTIAGFPT